MRITFATLDDFITELDREAAQGRVWRSEVFVRIDRAPEQHEAISFLVAIWGTAAVAGDDGDYLLEYGEVCGSDDRKNPDGGTNAANVRVERIRVLADKRQLTVRSGKLETV